MPDTNPSPPPASPSPDEAPLPGGARAAIPRVVSLVALLGVLVITGLFFFRVMALFLVPLFLAAVLVVVFEPLFKWFVQRMPGKKTLPALATTAVILLSVIVPFGLLGWRATVEVQQQLKLLFDEAGAAEGGWDAVSELWNADFDNAAPDSALAGLALSYQNVTGRRLDNAEYTLLKKQVISILGEEGPHSVVVGLKAAGSLAIGLLVMTVAVYFFFVDGPVMIQTAMHLSPLDDAYEQELLEQFTQVSRAVVLATVLSAVAQGLLAGVGYVVAISDGPVFLLTVLTMVLAMVPFVGAMAVWGFVAVVLYLQDHTGAAVGLAIYGAAIVSTVDNLIKPLVLHGQSKLHPLLALLSVLGGVTALGPVGILVGPMLVVFLQALLTMLRKELDLLQEDGAPPSVQPAPEGGPARKPNARRKR